PGRHGRYRDARPQAAADADRSDCTGEGQEVMLALLVEAALRSLALGGVVWLALTLLRVRDPRVQMTAWTVVLVASLSMPLIMHRLTLTLPSAAPILPLEIVTLPPALQPEPASPPMLAVEEGLPTPIAAPSELAKVAPHRDAAPTMTLGWRIDRWADWR